MKNRKIINQGKIAVVTGCDHGLGVALVKSALARGYQVFAGCLAPRRAWAMKHLKAQYGRKLAVFKIDMSAEGSIKRACAYIKKQVARVDLLINNAGMYFEDGIDKVDFGRFRRMFSVNAFGPIVLVRHLRKRLRASGKGRVMMVSSEAGSLKKVASARPILAYGASKAALNMFTRRLAYGLAQDGIKVVAVHPGWMKTPMGYTSGDHPMQDPTESADDLLKLAEKLDGAMNGGFFFHGGKRHPW